jgi:hypothetical protein
MKRENFKITGSEPHEPNETFSVIVNATNKKHAKDWLRWNLQLYRNGKSIKLECHPTNENATYYANQKHLI